MRIGTTAITTPMADIQKAIHAQSLPGSGRPSAVTATK
jgi:hypothetical protein